MSRLRRSPGGVLVLLGMFLLAGCASTASSSTPTAGVRVPSDPTQPAIEWRTSLAEATVSVVLIDPKAHYQVERIALASPGGEVYEAPELTRRTIRNDPYLGGGARVGIGGFSGGRRGGTGVGLSFPLFGRGSSGPVTRTEADIALPDPALYRSTAADWVIDIALTGPDGEPSSAEIPAPVN